MLPRVEKIQCNNGNYFLQISRKRKQLYIEKIILYTYVIYIYYSYIICIYYIVCLKIDYISKIYENITLMLFFYFLYFIFIYNNKYKEHILYTRIFFNNIIYIYTFLF